MTEGSVNALKLFSNTYFKMGFFKPIHNIIFDFIRNLEKIPNHKLLSFVLDNILLGYLQTNNQLNNNYLSTKLMYFQPSYNGLFYQTPNTPFIPTNSNTTYTLVLDLDETLVHFFYTPSGGTFLIRPHALQFLKNLSTMYEIVIFTAAMKDYADSILDVIDKDYSIIKHRLYRNHTSIVGNGFVKDISKIGRDLSRILIIDNLPENFKLQPNNGLAIKTWNEDMKDTQLVDLEKILTDIYNRRVPDIRVVIRKIKEEINRSNKNAFNPYLNIDISKYL